MDKICPDFIISSFKDACAVEKFHGKWMTADTWAKVIAHYFKLSDIFKFNGNQLIRALGLKRYALLNAEMTVTDRRKVPKDHIGIFRDMFRQHGKQRVHCFYAGPKGSSPKETETPWFNYINDGNDFLDKIITRSNTQELTNKTISLRVAGLKASEGKKRSEPITIEQLGEHSIIAYAKVVPDLPSSLANPCPPPPPFRYWDSTEAKVLFNARENEADALEAIENQLKLLRSANDAPNGHVLLIDEQDDELLEKMSEHQKWVI